MGRIILPILFVLLAGGVFFGYTDPTYKTIQSLQAQTKRLDEALAKATELRATRDQLLTKYNSFEAADRERLFKMVPDTIDNIRLIIDVDTIASSYGLEIKDFVFSQGSHEEVPDTTAANVRSSAQSPAGSPNTVSPRNSRLYDSILLNFNIDSTYTDFLAFVQDLEQSLRVVDISSVVLEPSTDDGDTYTFNITIATYWLI